MKGMGMQRQTGNVPDIEEVVSCTLCLPLPSTGNNPVTVYPMKAIKKKAREEIDLVSVVEWVDPEKPQDSWFLLTKRPEKGTFLPHTHTPLFRPIVVLKHELCLFMGTFATHAHSVIPLKFNVGASALCFIGVVAFLSAFPPQLLA
jgi:hypothetical protein